MSTRFAPGEPTLAHMIHQTYLLSWLVQTAGRAVVLLLLPLAIGWLAAGVTGSGFGAIAGLVLFEIFLMRAQAPLPTDKMVALLGPEPGHSEGGA